MALTQESGDSIRVLQYEEQRFTSNLVGQQGLQILQTCSGPVKGNTLLVGRPYNSICGINVVFS